MPTLQSTETQTEAPTIQESTIQTSTVNLSSSPVTQEASIQIPTTTTATDLVANTNPCTSSLPTQVETSPSTSAQSSDQFPATTNSPFNTLSSTKETTTLSLPTQSPSTLLDSTIFTSASVGTPQATASLTSCFYVVPNCQYCPRSAPLFDLNQGSVYCVFSSQQQMWMWTFTPSRTTYTNTGEFVVSGNSSALVQGNFINNATLNITSGSTIFVQGNFAQNSQGQIIFTFTPSQNNDKSAPVLNVQGCVLFNGNITLNLLSQPQPGTTILQVINYNCSQQVNLSSLHIQLNTNYNGSECDTINPQATIQPGIVEISIFSTLGNKCGGGKNLGVIIGLSVGIPLALLLIGLCVFFAIALKRKKKKEEKEEFNEMKKF